MDNVLTGHEKRADSEEILAEIEALGLAPDLFPEMEPMQAPPDLNTGQQLDMFRRMTLIRAFELAVMDLWKKNVIYGLAHSYEGAEATAVGACTALRSGDYISSTHRGHGHTIAKGADVNLMMAELMGKYSGYCHGKGGSMHIAAVDEGMLGATGIVGSGVPIAVGAAFSARVLKKDYVTVCFHGDGATNQGVWHESINLASVWNLPVIFLCENNQWAISCPYEKAAKNTDIALRAIGYGIPGVTVDGFNPFSVYQAVKEAAERARRGEGPSLIVAKLYRYVGHFVADDQHYRDVSKNEPWLKLEPINRMAHYLIETGIASQLEVQNIQAGAQEAIAEAIEFGKQSPEPPAESLFEGLYAADKTEREVGGR
jgi:acetoin:2,6-dichlorophenolindophenol oxidoreductase subunit alpha